MVISDNIKVINVETFDFINGNKMEAVKSKEHNNNGALKNRYLLSFSWGLFITFF